MNWRAELDRGIKALGIALDTAAQDKLVQYLELMHKWNKVYNLTAIRDMQQMVSHHILDSLAVIPYLWPKNWLDVGCGGGLPGIVLAICRPDWEFTLIDSNSKKTSFVQQAVIELGLKNVKVICGRVEEITGNQYDGIISRAFAEVADFVKLTRHLLHDQGKWAAMKGAPEEELKNLPGDIEVEQIIPLKILGMNAARCLVTLKVK